MPNAQIIDGKAIAAQVREEVAEAARILKTKGIVPGLHVVLVGEDPASQVYVRNKEKAAEKAGIAGVTHRLPAETSEDDVLELVRSLNANPEVDGILVQLPVPKHINPDRVTDNIDPAKDVDGFLPMSLGNLMSDRPGLVACTPAGCMRLIDSTGMELRGKRAVVVGRSIIVGKPMALLLLQRHATVTICHSRTEDLAERVREADVVVAAVGRTKMIRGNWIKPGAVVIDVGMNRDENGKLCGDVNFDEAMEIAGHVTPVPGGVGPMTIAYLLRNTIIAACARRGVESPLE